MDFVEADRGKQVQFDGARGARRNLEVSFPVTGPEDLAERVLFIYCILIAVSERGRDDGSINNRVATKEFFKETEEFRGLYSDSPGKC